MCCIGIDVSKARLDLGILSSGELCTFANNPDGLMELVEFIQNQQPTLVVFEATGGYERMLATYLAAASIPFALVNPRQVRDFAKATRRLAKTDQLDAMVLALFAERVKPEPTVLDDVHTQALADLLTRRQQLIQMSVMERNRLHNCPNPSARSSISQHLEFLATQLQTLQTQLAKAAKKLPAWSERAKLLQAVPGIGPTICMSLLANLSELGSLDNKRIVSLAGLAPFNRDSGTFRGERCIWGGRSDVRATLYMATLTAIRWNKPIKTFYNRLIQKGKPTKVALIACARKLLTILNAILRHKSKWNPDLALPQPNPT